MLNNIFQNNNDDYEHILNFFIQEQDKSRTRTGQEQDKNRTRTFIIIFIIIVFFISIFMRNNNNSNTLQIITIIQSYSNRSSIAIGPIVPIMEAEFPFCIATDTLWLR